MKCNECNSITINGLICHKRKCLNTNKIKIKKNRIGQNSTKTMKILATAAWCATKSLLIVFCFPEIDVHEYKGDPFLTTKSTTKKVRKSD